MLTKEELLSKISFIPSFIFDDEKYEIYIQALKAPQGSKIVELGCLFGSSTACLALAAPTATITVYDSFIWQPFPDNRATKESTLARLSKLGIHNVNIVVADTMRLPAHSGTIDLLFIDANHQFEFALNDLEKFGLASKLIILHDYLIKDVYLKQIHPGVEQAINTFLAKHPTYKLDYVVNSLAILCRI
jgi:predicted O-methyltransferase YrrM